MLCSIQSAVAIAAPTKRRWQRVAAVFSAVAAATPLVAFAEAVVKPT
jgi:hypothetical protein